MSQCQKNVIFFLESKINCHYPLIEITVRHWTTLFPERTYYSKECRRFKQTTKLTMECFSLEGIAAIAVHPCLSYEYFRNAFIYLLL